MHEGIKFEYRGGEIVAYVRAESEEHARTLLQLDGDSRVTFEVQPHYLHGDMWELAEQDEPEPISPTADEFVEGRYLPSSPDPEEQCATEELRRYGIP